MSGNLKEINKAVSALGEGSIAREEVRKCSSGSKGDLLPGQIPCESGETEGPGEGYVGRKGFISYSVLGIASQAYLLLFLQLWFTLSQVLSPQSPLAKFALCSISCSHCIHAPFPLTHSGRNFIGRSLVNGKYQTNYISGAERREWPFSLTPCPGCTGDCCGKHPMECKWSRVRGRKFWELWVKTSIYPTEK